MIDVLGLFGPVTREWFAGAFATPTPAQEGAWRAVAAGHHALVVDVERNLRARSPASASVEATGAAESDVTVGIRSSDPRR